MSELVGVNELARRRGVSRATIYNWLKEGDRRLPPPEPSPGARGCRWRREDVEAWAGAGFEWSEELDTWRRGLDMIRLANVALQGVVDAKAGLAKLDPYFRMVAGVVLAAIRNTNLPVSERYKFAVWGLSFDWQSLVASGKPPTPEQRRELEPVLDALRELSTITAREAALKLAHDLKTQKRKGAKA